MCKVWEPALRLHVLMEPCRVREVFDVNHAFEKAPHCTGTSVLNGRCGKWLPPKVPGNRQARLYSGRTPPRVSICHHYSRNFARARSTPGICASIRRMPRSPWPSHLVADPQAGCFAWTGTAAGLAVKPLWVMCPEPYYNIVAFILFSIIPI